MSIEWSRVYPEPGKLDRKALDHYRKMIDAILKRKVTPFVTLLHFTIPQWWDREGGFLNQRKEHLDHFRQFCETVATAFKGKVRFWNTINEIDVVIMGFMREEMPPGKANYLNALRANNTLLMMHTIAYRTLKSVIPDSRVGVVHNMQVVRPYRKSSLVDRALAGAVDYLFNGNLFRALKTGKLTTGLLGTYDGLKGSSDFIGLNFYNFLNISTSLPGLFAITTGNPRCGRERLCAGIGWEPYPEGLLISMRRLHNTLGLPIYITENGIGTDDDAWRQKVLIDHLKMVHRAVREGIDVRGYFHWSLIDNFEWAEGFMSRFGLVRVDFKTQKRTVKGSGRLYGEIAGKNALTDDILKRFPGDIYRPGLTE
jgi:beta-glucosidase